MLQRECATASSIDLGVVGRVDPDHRVDHV